MILKFIVVDFYSPANPLQQLGLKPHATYSSARPADSPLLTRYCLVKTMYSQSVCTPECHLRGNDLYCVSQKRGFKNSPKLYRDVKNDKKKSLHDLCEKKFNICFGFLMYCYFYFIIETQAKSQN